MRRKTSGNNFRAARKRGGFTLIELLIVVVIMAILVGVAGSLLAGFYNMFDMTTDNTTARRRANDVFNVTYDKTKAGLLPIPLYDIMQSKYNLIQNPGYSN